MHSTRASCLSVTFVAVIVLAGCSSGGMESQVTGRVTLDGKPVGPGVTVFTHSAGNSNPAIGAIQPDGSYSLKTSREVGLPAGKYKATVAIREQPANIQPGDRLPPGKLITPEKYDSVDTSGLEYDVAPGSNTINIELTSK